MANLIAKTPIKYGPNGEVAQPGETFWLNDAYDASIKQLVEAGSAELAEDPR